MNYEELIDKAIGTRTLNQAAKDWRIPQPTLHKCRFGGRTPDYLTSILIARDAGVSIEEAVRIIAKHEAERKHLTERIKTVFQWPRKTLNRAFKLA